MGFNSQGVHVESPTYRSNSEVGISQRSKQPLHSCNVIFPCSFNEFPFSVLWETIKHLRGHHSDATGCDALIRWASGCGANIHHWHFPAMTGRRIGKRCNVCSDVGEFKRNKLLLCKCDIGICAQCTLFPGIYHNPWYSGAFWYSADVADSFQIFKFGLHQIYSCYLCTRNVKLSLKAVSKIHFQAP